MFSVKELESFVSKANTSLELKFVRSEADILDHSLSFAPTFTHQVFGEKEAIFGYKDLKIKLYYTPDTLNTYIGLKYTSRSDSPKPDNVVKVLAEYIPEGFCTNLEEYIRRITLPTEFIPFGELQNAYSKGESTYEVYKTHIDTPGFREYHERLQTFLLWFVDASSFIDVDDERWSFYLIFERMTQDGATTYSIVGYTTVYGFYAYPDKLRPRISQMLILPLFQRKGHGAKLLQTVYDDLTPDPKVLDITVEDPSDEFIALRDTVDALNGLRLDCFLPPLVHQEFDEVMEKTCREKLKLNKKQARRVYEILRLKATDRADKEMYKTYRLSVKNRLNGPYQREQIDLKRLKQFMDPSELALTHPQTSHEDHMTQLHQDYKALEEEYLKIIERLATHSS